MRIVVAGRSRATANTNNTNHTTDARQAQGELLRPVGETGATLVSTPLEEHRTENGDEATRPADHEVAGMSRRQQSPTGGRAEEATGAQQRKRRGRTTKAHVTIGSQNMSGRGSLYSLDNKWTALSQTMREKKLGIMALQETHLPPEDVETVHKMYGKRIRLVNSPDPTNASGARGVAIALNRELVDISDVTSHVLVPGRALIVRTKWHNDKYITIMNIYALNDVAANEEFWAAIENALDNPRVPKPDVLLGDFNLVEEAIDRLPMKDSTPGAVEALQSLLGKLHLHDGWRITEPSCCDYTFPQRGSTTRSRLDRIYVSQDVLNRSYEWRIESTNIPTDHRLVSVQLTAAEAPYIGKG